MQKKQLIDLQKHFERFCNRLPVFGFNGAKHDIILIKSCLLPILVQERQIEPTFIKKANQFVSFAFGDVQLLDFMKFLCGATSLQSFLKSYKTEETKSFSPMKGSTIPTSSTENYLHTIPSVVNSVTLIPSKKMITTTLKNKLLVVHR